MTLNSIHGLFLGIAVASMSIHLNVYLGVCKSYYICTTQYMALGGILYMTYYIFGLAYWFAMDYYTKKYSKKERK